MRIHDNTCSVATGCICGAIESVPSHKFLGLTLDSGLTFSNHIDSVCSKMRSGVAILSRMRHLCSRDMKRSVYFALVESHFRYMLSIYGGSAECRITKILRLQKKTIRLISNSTRFAHSAPLFLDLGILDIIRLYALCLTSLFVPKLALLPKPGHEYSTRFRSAGQLSVTEVWSSRSRKMLLPNFIRIYNHLPIVLRNCVENYHVSRSDFLKRILKRHFHNVLTEDLRCILY